MCSITLLNPSKSRAPLVHLGIARQALEDSCWSAGWCGAPVAVKIEPKLKAIFNFGLGEETS
jgi:hypothetical protein